MTNEDRCWLAGIIEGEGCIHTTKTGSLLLKVSMTDLDVVTRVSTLLGRSVTTKVRNKPFKDVYSVRVWGQPAADILADIYDQLGSRRQAKTVKALLDFASRYRDPFLCRNGHRTIYPEDFCKDSNKRTRLPCRECRRTKGRLAIGKA